MHNCIAMPFGEKQASPVDNPSARQISSTKTCSDRALWSVAPYNFAERFATGASVRLRGAGVLPFHAVGAKSGQVLGLVRSCATCLWAPSERARRYDRAPDSTPSESRNRGLQVFWNNPCRSTAHETQKLLRHGDARPLAAGWSCEPGFDAKPGHWDKPANATLPRATAVNESLYFSDSYPSNTTGVTRPLEGAVIAGAEGATPPTTCSTCP